MTKKLTASVVGGGAGGQLSLAALAQSEYFELIALADLNDEVCARTAEKYSPLQTFTSYAEMFATCPTDVVCVSTYPPSHEEVFRAALQEQLQGILVEKPLGHTAASGRRILETAKARDLPLVVPHGLVAKRTPLEIIERVQRGEIGALQLVEVQCRGWDIINAGIHWLQFFVTLTRNEPLLPVMAICDTSTRTFRDGMQVETAAVTSVQTRSGIRLVMHTGDEILVNSEGKGTVFRLIGSAGQIEFFGWENLYHMRNEEFPAGTTITPEEYSVTGHQFHLKNLARMIESGQPEYSVPEASLAALEIVEGAYLSSRYQCAVSFPVDEFTPPPPNDWMAGEPYSGAGGGRDGRQF
jgi:predicted dehydrogenase